METDALGEKDSAKKEKTGAPYSICLSPDFFPELSRGNSLSFFK